MGSCGNSGPLVITEIKDLTPSMRIRWTFSEQFVSHLGAISNQIRMPLSHVLLYKAVEDRLGIEVISIQPNPSLQP